MKSGFWVRVELDPAYAEELTPENIRHACDEIRKIEGVDSALPAMASVAKVFDGYVGEEGWMLYNDPAVAQD